MDPRNNIWLTVSINGFLPEKFTITAGSIATIVLALTSDEFAWILGTTPI